MDPMKRGELEGHIEWAKVEFMKTGKIVELKTKGDSVCHFFEPFDINNDSITLRLDWSDLDAQGNPTLDADFHDKNTGKKRTLKGERKEAHHTSTAKPGERVYYWQFQGVEEPFKVSVGWLVSATMTVSVSCTAEAEVIKGDKSQS